MQPTVWSKTEIITTLLKQRGFSISESTISEYRCAWWHNTRNDTSHFRLTDQGLRVLQTLGVESYTVEIPPTVHWSGGLLLRLGSTINCPYAIQQNKIIVFDESIAIQLWLHDGDVENFVKVYYPA